MAASSLVAVLIAVALMLCGIGAAEAHAVLEQSAPADRSIQAEAPKNITLQFDEPVGVTDLRLLDATGKPIHLAVQANNNLIQAAIGEPLPGGTYTVTYRIISADGHPVAGAVQFQVGDGSAHWQAETEGLAWWQWGKIATRLLLYLGGFVFWGLTYRSVRRGLDTHRLAAIASFIVILAACLSIGFQGAGMTGRTPAQFLMSDIWMQGEATADGRIAVMFIAALAIGWLAQYLRAKRLVGVMLSLGCGAILILALSTAGHVATIGWLQMSVLTVHVAFALLWTSSLVPLLKRLRHRAVPHVPAPHVSVQRRRLPWLVMAAAIASGVALACWQIVEPRMLFSSAYGLTLSGKIAAVLGLVIAITVNRRIAARGAGHPALRSWILVQICLLVLALGLTAALGELTPPRHLLAADRDRRDAAMPLAIEKTVDAGNAMASIRLEPVAVQKSPATLAMGQSGGGRYRLMVSLMSMSDGKQLTPQEISVALSNLDVHVGPLKRGMTYDKATGSYVTQPLDLVPAGHWQFNIVVDLDDFDRRNFVLDAIIGR